MDKITVIIPVYNVEKYLDKCVQSVMNQTYTNLEIILVDDGSPDNCPKMCDDFAKGDSRIRVIHKQNGGLSDARNAGIDIATGEYLMFVDSDDYIAPTMVEKLYTALKTANADISICNFFYVGESNGDDYSERNTNLPIKNEVIASESVLKNKSQKDKPWYWIVVWNKLYKKEVFENIRFQVDKLHEDEYIFHEIFFNANRIACISDGLYYYVQRKDSIMGNKMNYKRLDATEALLLRCNAYMCKCGYEKIAVRELLSAASKFHGYYCSSHAVIDEKHKSRNIELQREFRILFRKMLRKKIKISVHDFIKISVNYISMYYSGKLIYHY